MLLPVDCNDVVYSQIPASLRDKVTVYLKTDPYGIVVQAVILTAGREPITCDLEPLTVGTSGAYTFRNLKIPDVVLAHLGVML